MRLSLFISIDDLLEKKIAIHLTFYILQRFYFNFHYLIINSAALPSSSSGSQISSTAVTHSSSCISLGPPKQGGRHRAFISLYFNDIDPTKTSDHQKAQ
ncbi:unnamed protein product, partial [Rotaria magnacalcarata]